MYNDFIPAPLAERKGWFQHQIDVPDADYISEGMTAPQVLAYKNHCQNQIDAITAIDLARANLASAVKDRETTSKVDEKAIRAQVKTFKTNPGYTPAKGAAQRVVDTHTDVDYAHYVPEIEGEAMPGYIRITSVMNGLENLNIYRRVKGTTVWGRPVATVRHAKFDDHSLPVGAAVYEYIIIGLMDDVEVTKESLIQVVTYAG